MNIELTLVRKGDLDPGVASTYAPDEYLRIIKYNYDNGGTMICLGDNDNTVLWTNNVFTFYDVFVETE